MFSGNQFNRSLFGGLAALLFATLLSGCMRPGVWSTDVATVRAALAAGEDPNFSRGGGRTPLVGISEKDARDAYGRVRDPAVGIPKAQRLEIARLLLDAGADPNKVGFRSTPLVSASYNCQSELVELLLQRGADPMLAPTGLTPVRAALACTRVVESERILGALLDQVERKHGREYMLRYSGIEANPAGGGLGGGIAGQSLGQMDMLAAAIWTDNRGIVAALIARGFSVNEVGPTIVQGEFNWTPLHWAMATGNLDVVTALMRAGADPTMKSGRGATPEQVVGYFLPEAVMTDFVASYVSSSARVAVTKDAASLIRAAKAYQNAIARSMVDNVGSKSPYAADPPPPGWNGLEEALKKRAALTAKPTSGTPSKTPAKPSSKPAYMTAPSAR